MNTQLKQPNPPSEGTKMPVYFDRKEVEAEVFNSRDFDGVTNYAIIRKPYTEPGVSISVRKL
jgi:hypothetical protein